jgi:superfamily II DNA or RNA helicase
MTDKNVSSNRRYFTNADRGAAFVAANGVCQECGTPLSASFHADHKIPFCAGGNTTLDNIQALCPACNLKKGGKTGVWMPNGLVLRKWQSEAVSLYISSINSGNPFLVQATPGAGKTIFACSVARYLRDTGRIDRVLVIAPSETLKFDWANDMSRFGIELDPDCGNGPERTSEFNGKSTTYQSLAGRGSDVERVIQNKQDTLVVVDEIHHAGDNLSWGIGLQNACKNARAILCLSGTPFRSDGKQIPFVRYNDNGQVIADYVYGYSDALSDHPQVCRAVYFPSYEGNMAWIEKDKTYKASFADELDDQSESARLRAALWSGEWVNKTLNEAKTKLAEIRSTHPDAAGLVVAMDKKHAEHIAKILGKITASKPLVITSDAPDAADQIDAFRVKSDPWIVAIKMISEGVDIKRLRVCVYLSNVITDLFFRQVVGRIVRYIPGIKDQEAFFYIPADRRLVDMAKHFQEERIQGLLQEAQNTQKNLEEQGAFDEFIDDLPAEFRVLSGEAWHDQTITYEGDAFSPQELEEATQFAKQYGYSVSPEVMAKMLRNHPAMRGETKSNGHKVDADVVRSPAYKKYEEVRQATKEQERKYAAELIHRYLSDMPLQDAYRKLHTGINRALGVKGKANSNHEQVGWRIQLMAEAVASPSKPAWL